MFNSLVCGCWAAEAPENFVLLSDDELKRTYSRTGCDRQAAGACLGELVVRWLVGDSDRKDVADIERFLAGEMPGGCIPDELLALRVCPASENVPARLWEARDGQTLDCEVVEPIVRHRVSSLFSGLDGYVPVYSLVDKMASFIPFNLVSRQDGGPSAVDCAGNVIEAWNEAAWQVLGDEWRMEVHYRQRSDAPVLFGRSFMLPLQVALWKRRGDLPAFLPWMMLFTGVIDKNTGVQPVQVEEKRSGVAARYQHDVKLVAPSGEHFADELCGIDALPVGLKDEKLLKAVRDRVETLSTLWMSRGYRDYALRRLPDFDCELRHETLGEWDRQIARIDAMLKVLGRHSATKQYLQLIMLKSAVYCHSGRTALALQENQKAREFAESNGLVYEALRLAIEELVEFQDSQRFDEIGELSGPLEERIASADVTETQRLDLRMRFNGTMGQVQMERGLLGLDAEAENRARELLEQALECAKELERIEQGRRGGDVLQDLNYKHLWHVLFRPESPELEELAEEMRQNCQSLASQAESVKNAAYESRQKMLLHYLEWKKSGRVSGNWRLITSPDRGSSSWLKASFMKMKGALLAASGKGEEAKNAFKEGTEALPVCGWWKLEDDVLSFGGVFAQIRLELLVQAFCSLLAVGLIDAAEDYRRQALTFVEEFPNVRKRAKFQELEDLLRSEVAPDPRALPILYY